jgi:hypothetical protein
VQTTVVAETEQRLVKNRTLRRGDSIVIEVGGERA